jgi:hypothetical protein
VDAAARREGDDVISKGDNGGPPSRNGASPEKPAESGPESGTGAEIELVISDRLDALERALGTVRRRGMTFKVHSLARRGGELVLVFRADAGAVLPDRWLAELAALVDVRQVKVAEEK